ncbi:MAG: ABC transporter ATP-binding protein, partial [Chloroflexota bacterium]|nr:ABC transporter ATP-binding protein [Chloroflexota bacterium]
MTSSTSEGSAGAGSASVADGTRPLLRVDELSVVLGGSRAVNSVSLSLDRGVVLGVVGANGSGKTTLLRAIAGLVEPEPGGGGNGGIAIFSSGRSVAAGDGGLAPGSEEPGLERLSQRDRARMVAYMPQQADSHPFSVFEAVLMGRYPHLGRFQLEGAGDRAMAWEAMER